MPWPIAPTTLAGVADDLLLKVTPPRVPRHQIARPRLQSDHERLRDHPVILVQAPAGYGKTSLLAQWRREHLAQGRVVAWLSAQPSDDVPRFVQSLALAVRAAAGRPTFAHTLLDGDPPSGLEGVTVWLADVTQSALDVVLIVDEADRLPAASRDALAYLLRNAPANLRAVVAARADCRFEIDDLITYGGATRIGPAELAFRLEETLELVRGRFGARVDRDAAARLHELAEGWPLGLQLALSVMAAGGDPQAEISVPSTQAGVLHDRFVNLLLANLDAADVAFLTRISILDVLHAELCASVAQVDDAAERLARLARDTPVFAAGEASDWLRMHALARDELRRRFALLPAGGAGGAARARRRRTRGAGPVRSGCPACARGRSSRSRLRPRRAQPVRVVDDPGRPGRGAGVARALAGRGGRSAAAACCWRRRGRWRSANATTRPASSSSASSPAPASTPRCAANARSSRAGRRSMPTTWTVSPRCTTPGRNDPPLSDPMLLQVHANRSAFRTLVDGEPALARLRQQQAPRGGRGEAQGYLGRWGDFIVGLSYLWEGQVLLAEKLLRPTLARAEVDLGRRSPFACVIAALLAAGLWERNDPQAGDLLANRLDVLERSALPEAVLLGFRTMARIASAEGAENRALELLGAMDAVGVARSLPRLRIASLGEQVRLHARRFRPETCRDLCAQIDAQLAAPDAPQGPIWRRNVALLREVAFAHAAVAAQDWRRAADILARADALAQGSQARPPAHRAAGTARLGARPLRREVAAPCCAKLSTSPPPTGCCASSTTPIPPSATGCARRCPPGRARRPSGRVRSPRRSRPVRPAPPRSTPNMVLTPKEREVLELLARHLSNKEIGLTMQVGEETIKWHMKNLFAKLDAGTRKQVVQRARILGLLEAEP